MRRLLLSFICLLFLGSSASALVSVQATVETDPVPHGGDAADDIAIWVHPADTALSTIIGTDKSGGIAVYDLAGKQLQYLSDGKMNNVDIRYGFPLGGAAIDLVGMTNRELGSVFATSTFLFPRMRTASTEKGAAIRAVVKP